MTVYSLAVEMAWWDDRVVINVMSVVRIHPSTAHTTMVMVVMHRDSLKKVRSSVRER